MDKRVRVLIADDHALIRAGTHQILDQEEDLEVVGDAADGEEAVREADRLHPDVVVMDVGMPGLNGLDATRLIKARHPEVGVLVLTVHDEEPYVISLLGAGAAGYLLKDVDGAELVKAVRAVQAGESVLHQVVAGKVLARFLEGSRPPAERLDNPLTDREFEVLRLAATGMTNANIARNLGLSARTVQAHLAHVFSKLKVASRTEAVIHGLRQGWFTLEDLP